MKTKLPIRILYIILIVLCIYLMLDLSIDNYVYSGHHKVFGDMPTSLIKSVYKALPSHAQQLIFYKEFLQYCRGNENIVHYNAIHFLGNFYAFGVEAPVDWESRSFSNFKYSFTDLSGSHFDLRIGEKRDKQPSAKLTNPVYLTQVPDQSDLRYCSSSRSGILTICDIQYTYRDGKLLETYWEQGSYGYTLTLLENGATYLRGFAARFLNADTTVSATKVLHFAVQVGSVFRQTRLVRIALQGLLAVLFLAWGILQKKNANKFCKNALLIEDEDTRRQYLKDCGRLKLLLAAVFAVMALVEYCEPVFFSAFLLLYAVLLGLAYWQYRLINKEVFAVCHSEPASNFGMLATGKHRDF